MVPDFERIRSCFRSLEYNISIHGFQEMEEDGITIPMLEEAVGGDNPEVIAHYPLDNRGPSCLVLGWLAPTEAIHICIGYGGDRPSVVTVYKPDNRWSEDFRTRRDRYGNESI